tara:strand:- start:5989 stop:6345 length:357 start_codon:yes stop_codon:yes gene_type:complete
MTTSNRAKKASNDNWSDKIDKTKAAFDKKKAAIRSRYADSGTSGREQMNKELNALTIAYSKGSDKRMDKANEDKDNVRRYGKDAMRGRSFAQYNKGGMVKKANCGASMKPTQKSSKGK